jgi:hypothetical protein
VRAESVVTLPVPGATEQPREKINLSITVPAKATPEPEKPARERIKSSALTSVDWMPFKGIPQRRFVFDTLRIFKRKGLVQFLQDRDMIDNEVDLFSFVGITVVRIYEKIRDVHRKGAIRKFGLVAGDIERFQRVADLFARMFEVRSVPVVEVNKRLDQIIEDLKKTGGRGQIRITSVKEQKDGSTLLEMEILRAPETNR